MLAEVRPDGFTMLDTYRLAFADGLFAVRDGVEIRVAQGDGIGAQLLRAQLGDDGRTDEPRSSCHEHSHGTPSSLDACLA